MFVDNSVNEIRVDWSVALSPCHVCVLGSLWVGGRTEKIKGCYAPIYPMFPYFPWKREKKGRKERKNEGRRNFYLGPIQRQSWRTHLT